MKVAVEASVVVEMEEVKVVVMVDLKEVHSVEGSQVVLEVEEVQEGEKDMSTRIQLKTMPRKDLSLL